MRLPISLLLLAAIGNADPKLTSDAPAGDTTNDTKDESKMNETKSPKRELFEGNYGLKNGAFVNLVTPGNPPKIKYADDLNQDLSDHAAHGIFGARVSQIAKISDVVTGQGGPFEVALANHLYSPVSIYQPRAPSPKSFKVSPPIPSQLAYSEYEIFKLNQNYSKEPHGHEIVDIPKKETKEPRFNHKNSSPDDSRQDTKLLHLESAYPRLETRYLRPGFLQDIVLQQPRFPGETQPQLLSRFSFHQPLQHESLKPVEIFHRQSLVKLVPVSSEVKYANQEESADGDENDNNKEDRNSYGDPSTVKPITYAYTSREPMRPIQIYNRHPQGAVSHSSFYQGEIHSSNAPQPIKSYSSVFPQAYREFQRYMPAIQLPTQLPVQYKLVPISQPLPEFKPKQVVVIPQPRYQQEEQGQQPIYLSQNHHHKQQNVHYEQIQQQNVPTLQPQLQDVYYQNQQIIQNQAVNEPKINKKPQSMAQIQTTNIDEELPNQILNQSEKQQISDSKKYAIFQTTEPVPTFESIADISNTPETVLQNEIQTTTISPHTTNQSHRYLHLFKPRSPRPLPQPRPFYIRRPIFPNRSTTPFPPFRRRPTTRIFSLAPITTASQLPTITTTSQPAPTDYSFILSTSTSSAEMEQTPIVTTKPNQKYVQIKTTTVQPLSSSTELESIELSTSPVTYPEPDVTTLQSLPTLTPSTIEPSSTIQTELEDVQSLSQDNSHLSSKEEPIKLSLSTQSIEQSSSPTQPTEQTLFQSQPILQHNSQPQDIIQHLSHAQIILQHASQSDDNNLEPTSQPNSILQSESQSHHSLQLVSQPQPDEVIQATPQPEYSPHPELPPQPLPGIIYDMQSEAQLSSRPLMQPDQIQSTSQPQYQTVSTLQPEYETQSTPQPQTRSTLEPQIQSSPDPEEANPYFSRPVFNLRPAYQPIPTPSPDPQLTSMSESTLPPQSSTPNSQSVSTIVTEPQLVVTSPSPLPSLVTLPQSTPSPYPHDEKKQNPFKHNLRPVPKLGQTYISQNAFLTPVQPILQPHIYSHSHAFIFRPDFQQGQVPVFSNVQYFGNYAEAIFGRYPHSFRDFSTD